LQDPACWACGGSRFLPDDLPDGSERTVALEADLHRTHAWEEDRRPYLALLCVAGGLAFALFLGGVGYWLGRASNPEPQVAQAAAPPAPVALPTPPTPLQTGRPPAFSAPPDPLPAPEPDPTVSVRSGSRPAGSPLPPPNVAPSTVLPSGGLGSAFRSRPSGEVTVAAQPFPAAQPRLPVPSAGTAVVALRNDTDAPVSVVFEGDDSRTANVSAGGLLPVVLPAGAYQVRVSGRDVEPARSATTLSGGKTYSLTVDARREEGRRLLVIVEPAVDGVPG